MRMLNPQEVKNVSGGQSNSQSQVAIATGGSVVISGGVVTVTPGTTYTSGDGAYASVTPGSVHIDGSVVITSRRSFRF